MPPPMRPPRAWPGTSPSGPTSGVGRGTPPTASYPKAWREAAFAIDSLTYLTSDELHDISVEIVAILDRYTDASPIGTSDRRARPPSPSSPPAIPSAHPSGN